jgi:hypothetical protein
MYVLTIEGLDTYILQSSDPADDQYCEKVKSALDHAKAASRQEVETAELAAWI